MRRRPLHRGDQCVLLIYSGPWQVEKYPLFALVHLTYLNEASSCQGVASKGAHQPTLFFKKVPCRIELKKKSYVIFHQLQVGIHFSLKFSYFVLFAEYCGKEYGIIMGYVNIYDMHEKWV